MDRECYPYMQLKVEEYFFVSNGKRKIAKSVTFDQAADKTVNLCFGDLRPDGGIDDKADSNNGDIVKVIATVLNILRQFCMQHPDTRVYIEGSTKLRTLLYNRVLNNYYTILSREFSILCYANNYDDIRLVPFDAQHKWQYWAFLITKQS